MLAPGHVDTNTQPQSCDEQAQDHEEHAIGFDALPEALQAVQDGTLIATVDQWPGRQTSGAMEVLVNYLRDGTEPAEKTLLIEPALITIDNLGEAERAEEAGITPTMAEATPAA